MITKTFVPNSTRVRVTFEVPSSIWAETIHLVGDFNDWDQRAHPLKKSRNGDAAWRVTLDLEPGRAYQFRYLVDGREWHNDWQADAYVPNPFGGDNSVVRT
ncbi:MAG: isoamylase early set domain-containing protein [Chloroflexi bacterium]|nr:isoamylase early set domain-containing protein [Chloroflexota bacterium]